MSLISVMMPCRNAASTLPMALASLMVQSHADWECILVDDGSTDGSQTVVERFDDPRIRYIRLNSWQGRSNARQIALDAAQGEFLCMLDADDWIYPGKLSLQLEFMRTHPDVDLVSTALAIVDRQGELVGVRSGGAAGESTSGRSWSGLTPPPFAHGPTMIRATAVAGAKYDTTLTRAEDSNFLSQILEDHAWAVLPDVTYAYDEYSSATPANIIAAHRAWLRHLWLHQDRYSKTYLRQTMVTSAKIAAQAIASGLNLTERIVKRRSQPPTAEQTVAFGSARAQVMETLRTHQIV